MNIPFPNKMTKILFLITKSFIVHKINYIHMKVGLLFRKYCDK